MKRLSRLIAWILALVMVLPMLGGCLPVAEAAEVETVATEEPLSVQDQNSLQAQMIERAKKIVEVSWEYKDNEDFPSWFYEWKYMTRTGNDAADEANIREATQFTRGTTYYGLPYCRPGVYKRITLQSESEMERKPEVPASNQDEALFHFVKPSGNQ